MRRAQLNQITVDLRKSVLLLSILYVIVSLYMYNKYGVKVMIDSPRYLNYAENLSSTGVYFDPLNFWYISYVFFVYLSQLIDSGEWVVVFNQYLLGYAAMIALFFGVKRLTANVQTAFLAGAIFIFFPDNLNWHSYVLTESLYCSVLCFAFYFLVRLWQERQKVWLYFAVAFVLLVCFFSKPTAPALFIALSFPLAWQWLSRPLHRALKLSAVFAVGILLLFLANKMISAHSVMLIYQKGDIIFAMHKFPDHPHHDLMTVDVPADLPVPEVNQPLLQQMGGVVIANPIFFFKLMAAKGVMYVAHIRPFWSWSHNLAMILFLWPLYFFSCRAIRKGLVSKYVATVGVDTLSGPEA